MTLVEGDLYAVGLRIEGMTVSANDSRVVHCCSVKILVDGTGGSGTSRGT